MNVMAGQVAGDLYVREKRLKRAERILESENLDFFALETVKE